MYELSQIRMVRENRTILSLDSLKIPTDKFTVILGHNGSGKSTTASLLSGLVRPDAGTVQLNGKDFFSFSDRDRARKAAFLPQKIPSSAGLTCRELVRLGRYPWRGLFMPWTAKDDAMVEEAMKATGTLRFASAFADDLSGGERQRVWIAMLLAQDCPVMILDEPTSALDVRHQYSILELLEQFNREKGKGIIVILHDINLALRFATHVIALKAGHLLFEGGPEILRNEGNLRDLFETEVKLIQHPCPPASWRQKDPLEVAIVCE